MESKDFFLVFTFNSEQSGEYDDRAQVLFFVCVKMVLFFVCELFSRGREFCLDEKKGASQQI